MDSSMGYDSVGILVIIIFQLGLCPFLQQICVWQIWKDGIGLLLNKFLDQALWSPNCLEFLPVCEIWNLEILKKRVSPLQFLDRTFGGIP